MGLEGRLTSRNRLTATTASNNLEFYVVDVDDKSEHPDGSSFKVNKDDLKVILGLDLLLNESTLENPSYPDIPAMLADQVNQNLGKIQHVIDATADITVAEGYAYYEFIGPAQANLANYRKLTDQEANLLQNNTALTTFNVQDVLELLGETVDSSRISFQYAGVNVTHILFNKVFSLYLKAYQIKLSTHDVEILIFNRTKQKTLIAKITALNYSNVDNLYYKASVDTGINPVDVSPSDIVDVQINILEKSEKITVFGNPFTLLKHRLNNDPAKVSVLENNDFILNGFRDDTTIWPMAQCLDAANKDLDVSWNVIGQKIKQIPFNP